jgi:hypothetical protein
MRIAVVLVAAYLLTGIHFVWRDLREPVYNQPGYASEYSVRGRIWPVFFMALYWLPGTVFSTYVRGPLRYHMVSWGIFVALIAAGLYLSSIWFPSRGG